MKTKIYMMATVLILVGVSPIRAGVWWEDGHIEINEGDVYDGELFIIEYGSVNMFDGSVGKLETWDYSTARIYGGEIDSLWTDDKSVVNIYGGTLNILASRPDSTVYLYAYDVTYHPQSDPFKDPWLEGIYLKENTTFSFRLYGDDSYSQVIIIPEPVTILLVGLGCLFMRKRE